jgi:hypothetical protein
MPKVNTDILRWARETAGLADVPEDGADDGEGEDEPNGAESEREMLELTSEDDE